MGGAGQRHHRPAQDRRAEQGRRRPRLVRLHWGPSVFNQANFDGWKNTYEWIVGNIDYKSGSETNGGGGDDLWIQVKVRDELSRYVYETFNDYTNEWKSQWHDVYDSRIKLGYQMVTQAQDVFDYRPVYQTVAKEVAVVTMQNVTTWETVPTYADRQVTRTEATTTTLNLGSAGGSESIRAASIEIESGAATRISGQLKAATSLAIEAGSLVQVSGERMLDASTKMNSRLEAGTTLSVDAGERIVLADTAILRASGTAATIGLSSGQDMSLAGDVAATGAFTASAQRNIALSGSITGASLSLAAGDGTAGDGGISGNDKASLRATAGDLVLSAGAHGGNIELNRSSLQATGEIRLTAESGSVVQTIDAATTRGSGLLTASSLVVTADNAIVVNTQVGTASVKLTEAGNIQLTNEGNLELVLAQAANGAIDVRNYGTLTAGQVHTLGASDRNDIRLQTLKVGSGTADIVLGRVGVGAGAGLLSERGDVEILSGGAISYAAGSLLTADEALVMAAGAVGMLTSVNSLQLTTTAAGSVSLTQSGRRLLVNKAVVNDGSFTLTVADESVELGLVRLANRDGNDISVTARKDILVRAATAGYFMVGSTDELFLDASEDPASAVTSATSRGNITLISQTGAIAESHADDAVDLVANRLTLSAATGITGLEIAANSLDARTSGGDIQLTESDGLGESSRGLDIVYAQTSKAPGGSATVSISAQNELRVGAKAADVANAANASVARANSDAIRGNFLRLESRAGSVLVNQPVAGDALDYDRGVAFIAADVVSLYRFFNAPDRMEYRAGSYFLFDNSTRLFPNTLSSKVLIIETGGTLSLVGTPATQTQPAVPAVIEASERLELIAGEDLNVNAIIRHTSGVASDRIGTVIMVAKGLRNADKAFDFNNDGDTTDVLRESNTPTDYNDGDTNDLVSEAALGLDLNGDGDMTDVLMEGKSYDFNRDGDTLDVLNEAALGLDLNGDGDMLDVLVESPSIDYNGDGDLDDVVNEASVSTPTGHLNIRANALPASRFELRARLDVTVDLDSELELTGFVGGVTGYDSARNVTLDIAGELTVVSGIVAANSSNGRLTVTAQSITSDGASVFIADNFIVQATNGVQLNTLVNRISVDSTVLGNVEINEATGLQVDRVVARAGAIKITTGGETRVRDVRNVADGHDITVEAAGDLWVGDIESGTSAGAQKTGGIVTVDATGRVREWESILRDDAGNAIGQALDQTSADLFGWKVVVREGATGPLLAPKFLNNATAAGTGLELEVRYTAVPSTDPNVLPGLSTGATTVKQSSLEARGGVVVSILNERTTAPGTTSTQVERLTFGAITLQAGSRVSLRVNSSITYTVAVGDSYDPGTGTVTVAATWQSVLDALDWKISQDNLLTVDPDYRDRQLTFTAKTANLGFTVDNVDGAARQQRLAHRQPGHQPGHRAHGAARLRDPAGHRRLVPQRHPERGHRLHGDRQRPRVHRAGRRQPRDRDHGCQRPGDQHRPVQAARRHDGQCGRHPGHQHGPQGHHRRQRGQGHHLHGDHRRHGGELQGHRHQRQHAGRQPGHGDHAGRLRGQRERQRHHHHVGCRRGGDLGPRRLDGGPGRRGHPGRQRRPRDRPERRGRPGRRRVHGGDRRRDLPLPGLGAGHRHHRQHRHRAAQPDRGGLVVRGVRQCDGPDHHQHRRRHQDHHGQRARAGS